MNERRKFLRFTTDVGMEYRTYQDRQITGLSFIKNISREGIGFFISRKLEKGALLDVKFALPGDTRPIYLTGEVVWISESAEKKDFEYDVGVRFFKIDTLDRGRLIDHAYTEWLKSSRHP
ncbi:MAG: PilZ domain-containing protein [Candidatus Omnitrophica bacterium]|nr:PilZ domain-containing protein [Candidatus Omnitrophota bacterium]